MDNTTTNILRETDNTFIAETANGAIRVGILDTIAVDYPATFVVDVAALLALSAVDFDDVVENLSGHDFSDGTYIVPAC